MEVSTLWHYVINVPKVEALLIAEDYINKPPSHGNSRPVLKRTTSTVASCFAPLSPSCGEQSLKKPGLSPPGLDGLGLDYTDTLSPLTDTAIGIE